MVEISVYHQWRYWVAWVSSPNSFNSFPLLKGRMFSSGCIAPAPFNFSGHMLSICVSGVLPTHGFQKEHFPHAFWAVRSSSVIYWADLIELNGFSPSQGRFNKDWVQCKRKCVQKAPEIRFRTKMLLAMCSQSCKQKGQHSSMNCCSKWSNGHLQPSPANRAKT